MPNTILSINDLETVTGGAIRSSSAGLGLGGLGGLDGGILPLLMQQQQQALLAQQNQGGFGQMMPLICCMMAMNKGGGHGSFFQNGPFGYSWQTA